MERTASGVKLHLGLGRSNDASVLSQKVAVSKIPDEIQVDVSYSPPPCHDNLGVESASSSSF